MKSDFLQNHLATGLVHQMPATSVPSKVQKRSCSCSSGFAAAAPPSTGKGAPALGILHPSHSSSLMESVIHAGRA